tara:strand:+ start:20120 stop:20386 length:267 start_codon:yes stop_codon:yes gene_type:complete
MPEQEALAYFQNLTDSERINYYLVSTPINTVGHVIRDNELGYYLIGIENVRDRCWKPSLGSSYSVVLAISNQHTVSELKIFGARSEWL